MKILDRSRKAQEAHAEQLLKLSTSLTTAFFIAILIVPISAVITASFNNSQNINPVDFYHNLFGSWYGVVFVLCEVICYYLAIKAKGNALSIYDELYPDQESEI